MKRSDSLKRRKEFRHTYRVGRSQATRLLVAIAVKNRTQGTRIGFSVSKKLGNSVHRNRVKRRLREAVTPLIPRIRTGYNIIFVAREAVANAPFLQIGADMQQLLERHGLLSDKTQ